MLTVFGKYGIPYQIHSHCENRLEILYKTPDRMPSDVSLSLIIYVRRTPWEYPGVRRTRTVSADLRGPALSAGPYQKLPWSPPTMERKTSAKRLYNKM